MPGHPRPARLPSQCGVAVLAFASAVWGVPGHGESLADPTRPPDFAAAGGASLPAGPVLQSVLISGERSVAVIDGETIPLGGRYGGAILVRISETGVELREGQTIRRLRLFPGVERRAASGQRATEPGPGAKDKP